VTPTPPAEGPATPHPVYPGGPPCAANCPGDWSDYHDGYADGYESGEREAAARLDPALDALVRLLKAVVAYQRPIDEHEPGDSHRYRVVCEVCGQRGQVVVSVEPQLVGGSWP